MTLIEKLKMTLDEITKVTSRAMENAQNERRLIFIYMEAMSICQMIASNPIPPTVEIDEEKFFKIHEEAAQNIWSLFSENLKRIGSKIVDEPSFQLSNPKEVFGVMRKVKTPYYMMQPAEMIQ